LVDGSGWLTGTIHKAAHWPRVTLSIVSHENGAEVLQVLEDLAKWEPQPERIRVVVTMNVPEAPRWVRDDWPFEVTTLRNGRAQGYAANHNQAFGRCDTPFFGVMNPDLRLPGAVVTEICDRLAVSASAMAAPVMTDRAGARADNARPLITPLEIAGRYMKGLRGARIFDGDSGRYDWVAGMFMVFDRDAFQAMGGFDRRFYLYCEDFDICARLRLAGRRFDVYEDLRVVHGARRRSHRDVRYLVWHLSSLLRAWSSSTFWRYRRMLTQERLSAPFFETADHAQEYPAPLHAAAVPAAFPETATRARAEHSVL
jgi:N-acetylglucosaminyl-diphospho-decaprenol L-rhamnosyltransferase